MQGMCIIQANVVKTHCTLARALEHGTLERGTGTLSTDTI